MATIERTTEINKKFEQLELGDSIFRHVLINWQFIAHIPSDVAETWITQHFADSLIARDGSTPRNGPMKEWEAGMGIVVGTPIALPGEERLNLLHKTGNEDFRLYLSMETRKTS